jgi:hypothetical protein
MTDYKARYSWRLVATGGGYSVCLFTTASRKYGSKDKIKLLPKSINCSGFGGVICPKPALAEFEARNVDEKRTMCGYHPVVRMIPATTRPSCLYKRTLLGNGRHITSCFRKHVDYVLCACRSLHGRILLFLRPDSTRI